jgi:Flp pilus assembly pilin Flp
MDKLRATAAGIVERADRSWRKLRSWALPSRPTDHRDTERGQGLAEYALILAGIAIVAIVSLAFLGGTISDLFWAPISEDFGEVLSRLGI